MPFSVCVSAVSYFDLTTSPRPGVEDDLIDGVSDDDTHRAIARIEEAGLNRLKSHLLEIERLGSAQVPCRQRRGDARHIHEGSLLPRTSPRFSRVCDTSTRVQFAVSSL